VGSRSSKLACESKGRDSVFVNVFEAENNEIQILKMDQRRIKDGMEMGAVQLREIAGNLCFAIIMFRTKKLSI